MTIPTLGRRHLLGLAAGSLAAALASGALASCSAASRNAGAQPTVGMRTGSFTSRFRPGTVTNWSVAVPDRTANAPGQPVPVALFLHGAGGTNRVVFDALGAHELLAQHISGGGAPFAIAAVDGGDTWWHRRSNGIDTQSMLLEEFLPLLGTQGLDTGTLGLFGLSMGGFGALLLASQGRVPGVRAIAAMSPAVWSQYDTGRQDTFDSAEDFAANDAFALRKNLESIPKRIDCGTEDNLLPTVKDYVEDLPGPREGGFQSGGHNDDYWRSILPDVVSFLGRNLGGNTGRGPG